jgi:hypothetical protein
MNPDEVFGEVGCTLPEAQAVFEKWLGSGYDQDALRAVLATAAVERLDGDPLWLLVISGSGNAKTETVQALMGAEAVLTSTISSEGALLSGTSKKERSKDATGGLLRQMGERGILVIKDVTSILSANRDTRASVLAALREVYDGKWNRNVGTDGGRTLDWIGRLAVVGAVTTAWDTAHEVIATMGDRFVLIRMDSDDDAIRLSAGFRALRNTGSETQMRAELAEAAGGVITGMDTEGIEPSEDEAKRLLSAANLVTRARTGVEYDRLGKVIGAHAPEMPTRFAKQLLQVLRGAVAIGVPRDEALKLAIRCARDSLSPDRLAIIDDLAAHPNSTPSDTRRRLNKPWSTVDRQMQALYQLGVIEVFEEETEFAGKQVTRWHYSLAEGIDPATLDPEPSPDLSVGVNRETERSDASHFPSMGSDISGEEEKGDSRVSEPATPAASLSTNGKGRPNPEARTGGASLCDRCGKPAAAAMLNAGNGVCYDCRKGRAA